MRWLRARLSELATLWRLWRLAGRGTSLDLATEMHRRGVADSCPAICSACAVERGAQWFTGASVKQCICCGTWTRGRNGSQA